MHWPKRLSQILAEHFSGATYGQEDSSAELCATFDHEMKNISKRFEMNPITEPSGYKTIMSLHPKNKERIKGSVVYRNNSYLLRMIDDQKILCLKIATEAYSPDRKIWVQKRRSGSHAKYPKKIKLLDKLNKVSRINVLKYPLKEKDRTPHFSPGMSET